MKVIYEKGIGEKIKDEIYNAKKEGKNIEKILLTYDEWNEILKLGVYDQEQTTMYYGIKIEVED